MKKLAFSLIAALAIFSVSCSKSDSNSDSANDTTKTAAAKGDLKSQVIAIATETITKIQDNPADADQLYEASSKQVKELISGLSEEEFQTLTTDAEVTKVVNALDAAYAAAKAGAQPADNGSDNGDISMPGTPDIEMSEMTEMAAMPAEM